MTSTRQRYGRSRKCRQPLRHRRARWSRQIDVSSLADAAALRISTVMELKPRRWRGPWLRRVASITLASIDRGSRLRAQPRIKQPAYPGRVNCTIHVLQGNPARSTMALPSPSGVCAGAGDKAAIATVRSSSSRATTWIEPSGLSASRAAPPSSRISRARKSM